MTTLNDLRDKMVDRALNLLDLAKPEDELEVFKAVSAFYSAAMKVGGGKGADPPPGGGFPELQRRLAGGAPAAKPNGGT